MKAFRFLVLLGILYPFVSYVSLAQVVVSNKNFSLGSTGRIGAGFSPSADGNTGRPLNLLGHGSLGGRLEQGDYIDLLPGIHFKPVTATADTTSILLMARLGMFASGGQFVGNVGSRSIDGLTFILPEAFVEAKNIMGSQWSAWAGARFTRHDDIHISDYFYFDDHSSEGFGVTYKNSTITMVFPAASDTTATYPPYSYLTDVNGTSSLGLRQRSVAIAEHTLDLPKGGSVKLLAEFHHMSGSSREASGIYPSDQGWVLGAKYKIPLPTNKPGSFNHLSMRYGQGIANGGDNGHTKTWVTYGAPDSVTKRYDGAYSFTMVEHFLLNFNNKFSLNGYGVYTKSHGGARGRDKAPDFYGRQIFNRKTDVAVGFRSFIYIKDWFHLLNEAHYTVRKDGNQAAATMTKFAVVPTIVPTGDRDPWARPHIRFIFAVAHYNKFAQENQYAYFLEQAGKKAWGTYLGARAEWWIF